jgi:hypothetical protein
LHTYYHCTRKKKLVLCSQRKNIPVKDLELQIERELEKYTILPEFRDWALEILNRRNDAELKTGTKSTRPSARPWPRPRESWIT